MRNFIPHETIVCDDKDPPWFNKRIKSLIQEDALLLETFRKTRNSVEIITCLDNFNDRLDLLINTTNQNFYSKIIEKFQNTQRSQMTGKKIMLFSSSKKAINKFLKTTVRYHYFLCVVKYLRN